jgi:hypothetical protein
MLLVTPVPCGSPPGAAAPARAVAVHAGSPAIALCPGAAALQAASPPDAAIAAPAMMVFNNDPEIARIDPSRIIAAKARSIHCSWQRRRFKNQRPSVVVAIAGFEWPP